MWYSSLHDSHNNIFAWSESRWHTLHPMSTLGRPKIVVGLLAFDLSTATAVHCLAGVDKKALAAIVEDFSVDAMFGMFRGWSRLHGAAMSTMSFSSTGSSASIFLFMNSLDSGENSPHLPERDAMVECFSSVAMSVDVKSLCFYYFF